MIPSQFERDLYCLRMAGYAVVPDFLAATEVALLQAEVSDFEAEVVAHAATSGGVNFRHGWPLRTTRALYCVSQRVQQLAMHARIQSIAQHYLDGAVIRDCLLQTNMPDENNKRRGAGGRLSYHRDTLWKDGEIVPSYLHAFVLLTDCTAENGATFVVPGSHRQREPGYYFKHTEPGVIEDGIEYRVYDQQYFPSATQLCARRGALIFLDPMAIHTQGINVTDSPRSLVNITFRHQAVVGNPPLLNAKQLATTCARVPMDAAFAAMLESSDCLPAHFGPLGRAGAEAGGGAAQVWEKVVL